jgi:hypothetical protein
MCETRMPALWATRPIVRTASDSDAISSALDLKTT